MRRGRGGTMNNNLWSLVTAFLKQRMRNKRWRRTAASHDIRSAVRLQDEAWRKEVNVKPLIPAILLMPATETKTELEKKG